MALRTGYMACGGMAATGLPDEAALQPEALAVNVWRVGMLITIEWINVSCTPFAVKHLRNGLPGRTVILGGGCGESPTKESGLRCGPQPLLCAILLKNTHKRLST